MCEQCNEWKNKANNIWNQVFFEYKRLQDSILLLPSPFKEQLMAIRQQYMSPRLRHDQVFNGIEQLAQHPASWISTEEYVKFWEHRNQAITAGQQWLQFLKEYADKSEQFIEMQNANKMRMQYMNAQQQIQAENDVHYQDMLARTEEVAQRWVDIFSGRPFIDLRLRRF